MLEKTIRNIKFNTIHPIFQTSVISVIHKFISLEREDKREETFLITIYIITDFLIQHVGVPQYSDLTRRQLP